MRVVIRSLGIALLVLSSTILLALTSTMTSVVALTAAAGTVYIVKGTNSAINQLPDSAYPQFAYTYDKAVGAPAPTPVTTPYPYYLVPYPAAFFPITPPGFIFSPTFDQSVAAGVASLESSRPVTSTSAGDVLWGYSQGATVVTQYKRDFNAAYPTSPAAVAPTFVLVANPNRPNGGILERGAALGTVPIFGVTFNGATPTTTAGVPAGTITTYDIARQYDGIADAPTNPLNLVSDANAIIGFAYLHGQYANTDPATAINQGTYGDTHYYLIPTYPLPLLMPIQQIGSALPGGTAITGPLVDTLDPPLRVIVEAGYDRTTSPGQPTPFNVLYFPNPTPFGTNLLIAVPSGLDNGFQDVGLGRALGTSPSTNTFGVGGPAPNSASQMATVSPATPDTESSANEPAATAIANINDVTASTHPVPAAPHPPTALATKPQMPLIRGPISGSPSLPGADNAASSINGAVKSITTAVINHVTSVTSAVSNGVSAGTGTSTTGNSAAGGSPNSTGAQ
jgi:hypothetical protein